MEKIIQYIGGKHLLVNTIVNMLDYSLDCYVELFVGGGSVLFAKPPHKVELINDKDGDLINLYRVCHSKKIKELRRKLYYTPYSREIYEEITQRWKQGVKPQNDVDRAVEYCVLIQMAFAGAMGTGWGYSSSALSKRFHFHFNKKLLQCHKRLCNVQIEHNDFRKILGFLQRTRTKACIYADPPYYGTEHWYKELFTKQDHIDLAEMLRTLKDKHQIIVSYKDCEFIRSLYSDFNITTKEIVYTAKNAITTGKKTPATELLIYNYLPEKNQEGALFDDDFEYEEVINYAD